MSSRIDLSCVFFFDIILHPVKSSRFTQQAAVFFNSLASVWQFSRLYRHLTTEINERRELILTLASQSVTAPLSPLPPFFPLDCAEVFSSCAPFPRFNKQLAHARNGRNTSDELKLASGASKSSIRYVSTSPEGWIDSASKSGWSRRGEKGGG